MLSLPGSARLHCVAENVDQLRAALECARSRSLRVIVLGEGSNVVLGQLSDAMVLTPAMTGIDVLDDSASRVVIRVAAGENWHSLVRNSLAHAWYGLENLALIPGSVGAAPVQNIGAYGVELSELCTAVEVICIEDGRSLVLERDQCEFAYRESLFKRQDANYLIHAVRLELSREARLRVSYPALVEVFERTGEDVTPATIFNTVCRLRREKLPDPELLPNVGSFFKNPVVDRKQFSALRASFPGIVAWPAGENIKLAAAWLLERAGWRGHRDGPVGMHAQQALVLVNYGGADVKSVCSYAERVRNDILVRFGVRLEVEPQIYADELS